MEARVLRRPLVDLFSHRSQCAFLSNPPAARRHQSSFRRTKQRLRVAPDASFAPSKTQDHIIFNPPSSAPSVLHTPLLFLPKEDKRRALFASAAAKKTANGELPPPTFVPKPGYQRHHLTEADVAEIKRLRSTDPEQWSSTRLAKKFNCNARFVAMCCEAPQEKKDLEKAKLEAVKARWGPKKRMAREDRAKRQEMAKRDE